MPLSKEYISSDSDSDSGSGSDGDHDINPKKTKLQPKDEAKDEANNKNESKVKAKEATGNKSFELSNKRRVTVSKFRSSVLVDIREFYQSGEKELPGKKGISLTAEQFFKLKALIPEIEAAVLELQ